MLSYVVDYGDKLLPMLQARIKRQPDPLFQFLFEPESDASKFFFYSVDKMTKNRKKKGKTRFGPGRTLMPTPKVQKVPSPKDVREKAAMIAQPYNVASLTTRKTFVERVEDPDLYDPFEDVSKSGMYDPLNDV